MYNVPLLPASHTYRNNTHALQLQHQTSQYKIGNRSCTRVGTDRHTGRRPIAAVTTNTVVTN